MKCNISKSPPPAMPNLVRGTKFMLFLLSKVPKDMHLPIVPILFSLLESHASDAKFTHPDQKWEEMCGMMGNLMADRRRRKGPTVMTTGRAICRNFRLHEEEELTKLGARTWYSTCPRWRWPSVCTTATARPPSGSPHARQGSSQITWANRWEARTAK